MPNDATTLFRVAHISDVHFGRITHPEIVDILVREINASGIDLVAASGDLTQRARRSQYRAAASMLESLDPPVIVVPGNHDVYPWWRPVSRFIRPLARYRKYIRNDLYPTFEGEGVAVLGINSAIGHTVKGGRITSSQMARIEAYFSPLASATFKILVVHHHLAQIAALGPHDIARNARKTLEAASRAGVDLVLCGHLHISHVEPVEIVPSNHRVVIASAGTATSNRGRKTNRDTNFYNIIEVKRDSFFIRERRFDPDTRCFVQHAETRFARLPEQPGGSV